MKQTRYVWVYALGAACSTSGKTAGSISLSLNTDVVNVLFERTAQEINDGVHLVMIWDQAVYHTSGKFNVPGNTTPIELPPYSPRLHPIEDLRHNLRSHHRARAYDDYNDLHHTACDAWQNVCLDPETI